jgi:signal transduction histidine kinase
MTRNRLRLSFRTRLGLIITVVFIAAGAGLLAVQYVVVQQLFATAMRITTISCSAETPVGESGPTVPTGCAVMGAQGDPQFIEGVRIQGGAAKNTTTGAVIQQSVFLSNEVSGGLFVWSIVMLIVFAGVAAAIAFWLARRSMDRISEVTAAARDISERDLGRRLDLPGPDDEIKELGDTFDGMLDRLQLAFAAQDRFVANASHELRTPLTTTRTALEIPLEQGAVPAALEPALRTALRATLQSERLIAALLSLARGRAHLDNVESVQLDVIAASELEELADAARARKVRIESSIGAASTEGDPALLGRAVRNLLENGIHHNSSRGGRLWLRVGTEAGMAVVEVQNTGALLDPATVALLTEPFYRGDASRTKAGDRDGMGLGLAIVESIAVTHGGQLHVAARPEGGLVATLRLPTLPALSPA